MTDDELRALLDGSNSAVDYGRAVENAAYERATASLTALRGQWYRHGSQYAERSALLRGEATIRDLIVPRQ